MKKKPRVYKRSGDKTYSFYFYDDNGKRIFRKTEETAKSKAEDEAADYVRDYFEKKSEVQITLDSFAADFFKWNTCGWIKRQHAKGRSFTEPVAHDRRAHLDNHILPEFGKKLLTQLNRYDIENWLVSLSLSNQSKNHILYSFRIVLSDAELAGYIDRNPLEKVERFGLADKKERDIFTLDELDLLFPENDIELLKIWESLKLASAFSILASTGIRRGEVCALRWRHRLTDNVLYVENAVKRSGKIGLPKNKDSHLAVINDRARRLLDEWRDSEENKYTEPEDFIYCGRYRDKPYSPEHLSRVFNEALKRSEIEVNGRNLVTHSLRHTYSTLIQKAVTAELAQELIGHKSQAMLKNYNHPSLEDRLKTVQASAKQIEAAWK